MYLNSDVVPRYDTLMVKNSDLSIILAVSDKSKNTCSVYINKDVFLPVGTKITAMFFVTDDNWCIYLYYSKC